MKDRCACNPWKGPSISEINDEQFDIFISMLKNTFQFRIFRLGEGRVETPGIYVVREQ
jgi:hypothetical protein